MRFEKRQELTRKAMHGVVAADATGMTPSARSRAVAAGELVRGTPRTMVLPWAGDDLTPLAATLVAYPAAVASHRAAAWLWRLDGIETCWHDVTVPRGASVSVPGVRTTSDLQPFEVREVDGLRATDPTRISAPCVTTPLVELALESALRRRLTSVKRLEWRMRLDMAYPDDKVFVELDGWEFHRSGDAFERDRARQNDMVTVGWAPLRFTWPRRRREAGADVRTDA